MERLNKFIQNATNNLEEKLPRNWFDQLTISVLNFRKSVKGTRIGFVDLEIPGLRVQIKDCVVHRYSSGVYWVQVPSRGGAGTGATGFKTIIKFTDKAVARRVSERIVRQLADHYPEDFSDFDQG